MRMTKRCEHWSRFGINHERPILIQESEEQMGMDRSLLLTFIVLCIVEALRSLARAELSRRKIRNLSSHLLAFDNKAYVRGRSPVLATFSMTPGRSRQQGSLKSDGEPNAFDITRVFDLYNIVLLTT
ncbi:hypothetical protein Agabi119p4_11228 [Agaricus bisporus var. burnettii]|uniref:Uncharacterized protein n=1 Tax=Agaricus bisporus var. burnettii TaxID=192524 RepID=A0A8H7C1F0_AGABI|nr:hypothetical protein Agabi119p4_11228 [Agaricus bisporus var. burnettii]